MSDGDGKLMNELTQRRLQVESLRNQLASVTAERDDQRARKDALLADRSKGCKLAHANECMTGCKYRMMEQRIAELEAQQARKEMP